MTVREQSQAVEDYVKAIWLMTERADQCTGSALAGRLGVTQASVTAMLQRLAEHGLVVYERYRPVSLTDSGRELALEIVRHHRLLELFLVEELGMPWDEVHAEAEVLEHHISERLEDVISARLGNPTFDPHGHPIPTREGQIPSRDLLRLLDVEAGVTAVMQQVRDEQVEVLRWLGDQGLTPGCQVVVVEHHPYAGTVSVQLRGSEVIVLGERIAARIDVSLTAGGG